MKFLLKPTIILSLFMGMCTMIFGLLFGFTDYPREYLKIDGNSRIIMAMFFVAYSIFRFVRVYQMIKADDQSE
jgi:vacuolar-type H+-ATPase subunit I/STV1